MKHTLTLRVAGVALSASANRPFDLDAGFERFLYDRTPEVRVRAAIGPIPTPKATETLVWNSRRGWTVSRWGKDWVFRVTGAENRHPPPLWMRLSPSGRSGVARMEGDSPRLYNLLSVPLGPLLLLHVLHERGGLLLHGCGVRMGRSAFACAARSGGGKTTLAGNLAGQPGVEVLSDDTLALVPGRGRWHLHGTPWSGHPQHAAASQGVIEGIGFLRQGRMLSERCLAPGEFVRRLVARIFIPWWLPDGAARCIQAARQVAAGVEGRMFTLTATRAAGQFVAEAFAGRESRTLPDSTR